jgi:hypothetical protein
MSTATSQANRRQTLLKLSLVPLGYVVAFVTALAAACVRGVLMSESMSGASSGMGAFGDLLFFLGVFGLLALVPTAWLLVMARRYPRLWTIFSAGALAFSIVGPIAAVAMERLQPESDVAVLYTIGQILGAPLLAIGFVAFAVIAPNSASRRMLLAAGLIEGLVCAYVVLCLFVVHHWLL